MKIVVCFVVVMLVVCEGSFLHSSRRVCQKYAKEWCAKRIGALQEDVALAPFQSACEQHFGIGRDERLTSQQIKEQLIEQRRASNGEAMRLYGKRRREKRGRAQTLEC